MAENERLDLFDRWAGTYNPAGSGDRFPFIGYGQVLEAVVDRAAPRPGMQVLDMGIGTGNLAARFAAAGCRVWGVDFSPKMLEQAGRSLPGVQLARADVRGPLPGELHRRFDRIVSAYVLHEFDLTGKVRLLEAWSRTMLVPEGSVVIGDIGFPTVAAREQARKRWAGLWDDEEFYWAADEALPALAALGLQAEWEQISPCAGVLVVRPPGEDGGSPP